jgi:hypothetical protein
MAVRLESTSISRDRSRVSRPISPVDTELRRSLGLSIVLIQADNSVIIDYPDSELTVFGICRCLV